MLLDLPHAIIIRIAEHLPLTDLPNFIASCKTLAAMADDFYEECKCLDMSCFESPTLSPRVCEQLIRRFSAARLHSCIFRFDVGWHYRFLSSQPQRRELDVDLELSLFKIPNSKGQRLDWHMLSPFVTTDAVQRNCP